MIAGIRSPIAVEDLNWQPRFGIVLAKFTIDLIAGAT
jgi:hypothetical protein